MNSSIFKLTALQTLGPSDVGKLYFIIKKDSGTKTPMEYMGDTVPIDGKLSKRFKLVRSVQPTEPYHYRPDDNTVDLYEINLPKDIVIKMNSYLGYRGGKVRNKRRYKKYTRKNKKTIKKRKATRKNPPKKRILFKTT